MRSMDPRSRIFLLFIAFPLAAAAQYNPGRPDASPSHANPAPHRFADKTNLQLFAVNTASQTMALLAIQLQSKGSGMAACGNPPCLGALAGD